MKSLVPRSIRVAASGVLVASLWSAIARPWMLTWGATTEEQNRTLPGDDIVTCPDSVATRAITILAAPDAVWPWIVQMGQDRAGFYTYDWLENLFGARIHNANQIVPAWQDVRPGDLMRTYRYLGPLEPMGWFVETIEHQRHLVLRSKDGGYSAAFVLERERGGATRLVVRSRSRAMSRITLPFTWLVFEPAHFTMERGMLRGIRTRAEAHHTLA